MLRLWHCVVLIVLFAGATQAERTVYTFEDASHLTAFTASSPSTLELSTTRYKDATHSMKWNWTSGATITHSFTSNVIKEDELQRGGIKLWLYNTHKRVGEYETLTVSFLDKLTSPGDPSTLSQFNINLNFKGWRGIWVSYQESNVASGRHIDTLIITAPTTTLDTHPLFFDVLRLVSSLSKQTRDEIVPTIGQGIYTPKDFWQQTYRWSLATPTSITNTTPNQVKLDDLALIENRLENWFVKQSQSSVQFTGNAKKRFESLPVDRSHEEFGKLEIVKSAEGVITGWPLFAKHSDCSQEGESDCGQSQKFGYVMAKILLPLALDHHIRSRGIDVNDTAAEKLSNLNGDAESKNQSIRRIAGADQVMQQTFTNALGSSPYTEEKVKEAIATLNNKRKERLFLILDYIVDQGFTDGSGLGTLDHEMNNVGAGFMSSVFLLRKELQAAGNLSDYLATMKWYNDFGEVYQDAFEYVGTTADRMRTIALWRLFTVLMMPASTTQDKQEKVRDMEALRRWYVNALSPNEGLAGTLKPDYVDYHHYSYYASAYTPHALHNAALIQYLLSGTTFALGAETEGHIKKGLEVMRIVSVKYSSPNSVSGRFPGFSNGILAKSLPAYAYTAATAPVLNDDGSFGEISISNNETLTMFLRLYDTSESMVNDYLADGTISSHTVYYLNSIGSVNVMEEIHAKAKTMSIKAEGSPQGCWTKNYAALFIQRREDWAVSVKGFSKHIWDFEASDDQNIFGLYQSHGALLVANSEEALLTHDVHNGWDWTRHPGTTTIKMDLVQLISDHYRYFQPERLAGGLTLVGGGDYATGIFGMDFSQPAYRFPSGSFQLDIKFSFKKSVFFSDHVIICLGTGISSSNSSPNITQTTLFQNKLLDLDNPSTILINNTSHSLSTDLTREPSFFGDGNNAATLRDVNGNGYYVPYANSQGLNLKISLQRSRDEGDKKKETSARYATAWLNHGINPSDASYEYSIVVNQNAQELAKRQASDNKVYEVLHKDNNAHVVKINDCSRVGATQYGYVFFNESVRTPGPVTGVDKAPCIVMVEEVDNKNLYIAVSSPDLNFNISRVLESSHDINSDERLHSISMPVEIQVFVRNAVHVATGDVRVNGAVVPVTDKTNHVTVKPRLGSTTEGRVIKFKQLVKGFCKEVKLTR